MYLSKQVIVIILICLFFATIAPAQESEPINWRKIGALGKLSRIFFLIAVIYSIIAYSKDFLKFLYNKLTRRYNPDLPIEALMNKNYSKGIEHQTQRERNYSKEIEALMNADFIAMKTTELDRIYEKLILMPPDPSRNLLLSKVEVILKKRGYRL